MRRGKSTDRLSKKIVSGMLFALFLITIATLPCNIQPVKAELSNVIATYDQGYLRDINGLLVLNVKGSPYEMGYQYGFMLKGRVQANIQSWIEYWIDQGYSYDHMVTSAQVMEPHIPQEYIQEMRGLAEGAGMNYSDVLIYQCPEFRLPTPGCSGFVVFGEASADGHLYHGRNHDYYWPPEMVPLMIGPVIVYEPVSGNPYVTTFSEGFGSIMAFSGMNNQGITLGMKGSRSRDVTLDGMPFGLMLKQVLQYSDDLSGAIDTLLQSPRTIGLNILLGDSKNLSAAVVEISANYSKVFWAGDPTEDVEPHYSIPNAVRRANHYVDPDLAATQRDPYDVRLYDPTYGWGYSWLRYEKLGELIEENYGMIDAERAMEFMRTPPVAQDPYNLGCVLFDSSDLELWLACANSTTPAYLREFVYLSWDDLFPRYDLTIPSATGGSVTTPGEGTFMYSYRTVVNLVAEPDEGYRFVNWTGDTDIIADVNAASTTITMNDDYSITANFEEIPPVPTGCFIATAAYNTPMAEEIQILRAFRDAYLLTNPLGQALVDVYYRISPPIAGFITEHPSLKPIVRAGLMPVVAIYSMFLNIASQFTNNEV